MGLKIRWTNELSVGVELIDRQHQELFERTDRLLTACESGHSAGEIQATLDYLHQYVSSHFSAEEELMDRHRYPQVDFHRRQHLAFCRQLDDLERQLATAREHDRIIARINDAVVDWLYEHVCMEDRQLGQFLKQQGN